MMTFLANPEWPRHQPFSGFFDVTITTEVMKHLFDLQRHTLIMFMTRVTGVMSGIVDIIMMAIRALNVLMIQMFERHGQNRMLANRLVMPDDQACQ